MNNIVGMKDYLPEDVYDNYTRLKEFIKIYKIKSIIFKNRNKLKNIAPNATFNFLEPRDEEKLNPKQKSRFSVRVQYDYIKKLPDDDSVGGIGLKQAHGNRITCRKRTINIKIVIIGMLEPLIQVHLKRN